MRAEYFLLFFTRFLNAVAMKVKAQGWGDLLPKGAPPPPPSGAQFRFPLNPLVFTFRLHSHYQFPRLFFMTRKAPAATPSRAAIAFHGSGGLGERVTVT